MTVDATPHLIVPFAQCGGDEGLSAVSALKLSKLGQLLRAMKLVNTDNGPPDSLSPPHERALARALGLASNTDGLIPWAALEAQTQTYAQAIPGQGWAVITPCHWAMGREHATLTDPATLKLSEAESRTLLATMQPYFATEGITLHYAQPTRWLAEGEVFRSLPTASLDRVLGRNVDRWLPNSKAIKLLQNEMQMLLYTHPVNDERAARGQVSVNSFWLSGSGALKGAAGSCPLLKTATHLVQPALANDWAGYAQAWAELDEVDIAQLLAQQKSGTTVRLSLCSDSKALTFETAPQGVLAKIRGVLSPLPAINVLKQLSKYE